MAGHIAVDMEAADAEEEGNRTSAADVVSVRLETAVQEVAVGRAGVSEDAERTDSETAGVDARHCFRMMVLAEADTVVQRVPQVEPAYVVIVLEFGVDRAGGLR